MKIRNKNFFSVAKQASGGGVFKLNSLETCKVINLKKASIKGGKL